MFTRSTVFWPTAMMAVDPSSKDGAQVKLRVADPSSLKYCSQAGAIGAIFVHKEHGQGLSKIRPKNL